MPSIITLFDAPPAVDVSAPAENEVESEQPSVLQRLHRMIELDREAGEYGPPPLPAPAGHAEDSHSRS